VNGVPVANYRENQQQKGDQQQAGRFRGVNRVPQILGDSVVLALGINHEHIVRRHLPYAWGNTSGCYTTRRR